VEAEKTDAATAAQEKADAEKAQAIANAEIEREKVAANKREEITAAAKASKDARDAISKERQDSLDEKIKIAKQDFEMKKYIQTTLATAHTDRNQMAGLVQTQVESLAGAAKNVAETIHHIHQNRVDGLNKGVTDRIQGVDDKIDQGIEDVNVKIEKTHKATTNAVNRNTVRAHALAQDIIDRHDVKNFRKEEVCKTFIEEAKKEVEEEKPGKWQDKSYYTKPTQRCPVCNREEDHQVARLREDAQPDADGACERCQNVRYVTDLPLTRENKEAYIAEKFRIDSRRRLASNYASMTPSEQALERRRLMNRPKSHIVVLEQLLKEINRLN